MSSSGGLLSESIDLEHTKSRLADSASILSVLDNIPIFGGLDSMQLGKVLSQLQQVHYEPGEVIFREGECASNIYVVLSGRVKLAFDMNGRLLNKAELTEGTCFGETSVIGIQPHSATTIAIEPSELLVLSGDTLAELFEMDKELFAMLLLNIARESCRRLYLTNKQLTEYLSSHPELSMEDIQRY